MQFPLDSKDYEALIAEFDNIVAEHQKSVGTLPASQLDRIDFTGKVAPCCKQDANCTCSAPDIFNMFSQDKYGPAQDKYGSVPFIYNN